MPVYMKHYRLAAATYFNYNCINLLTLAKTVCISKLLILRQHWYNNASLAWQVCERCNMTTNIGYNVLVSCNQQLVADFASDPGGNAGVMFQNRLISDETNQKIIQLHKTNTDKARMLVIELQAKVKSFPGTYDEFIAILRERNERHDDLLLSVLTDKYKELEAVDQANSAGMCVI